MGERYYEGDFEDVYGNGSGAGRYHAVLCAVEGNRPGEGQVNIVAWAGYIERGETDKKFDWVTKFEKPPAARSTSRPPTRPTKWSR
jgi:hypothetical protein